MKNKAIVVMAACGLSAVSIAVGAYAAINVREIKAQLRQDFSIVIDGEQRTFKNANGEAVYPILYDGTTYLPVRSIGELMGKTVYWYEADKKIEFKDRSTTVTDADVIIPGEQQTDKQLSDNAAVSKAKAKEIALNKVGLSETDVWFIKTELDSDNGIWFYEIEFIKDNVKYSIDVAASDGAILSHDADSHKNNAVNTPSQIEDIGLEKAKEISLKKAGLSAADVHFTEQKPDCDNGQKLYELEFISGKTKYSADIAASDGAVLSWEIDND